MCQEHQFNFWLRLVCLSFLSLLHFDVIHDLLLNRHTAKWNDDKNNDDDDGDDVNDADNEDDNGMMITKKILMMMTTMTMTMVRMMMRT